MTKMFLTIACIVALACSMGCQKESAAHTSNESASPRIETEPNCSNTTLTPFWPASEKEHRITKRETVRSRYASLDGRKVLRLETDIVEVTFDIRDVIEHLDTHVHLECDRILAERLRKESDSRSQFRCSEFTGQDSERLYFCLAYLLEQGKFVITLQSNGDIVSEITLREWSNIRGPLDGIGGQAFCLKDGRVFFWIVNWIS